MGSHDIGSVPGAAIDPGGPGLAAHGARLMIDDEARAWVTGDLARLSIPHPPGGEVRDRPEDLLDGARRWLPGIDLAVGDSLLRLVDPRATGDLDRSARTLVPSRHLLPAPPTRPKGRPVPPQLTLAPLVLAPALAAVLDSLPYLGVAALTPMMALVNAYLHRRGGLRRYREDLAGYERDRLAAVRELTDAVNDERRARCDASPDPAAVLVAATGPGHPLWERRPHDPGRLVVRVGTADQPSLTEIEDQARPQGERHIRWIVPDVPVTLDLTGHGVVGVTGDRAVADAVARWLLIQVAALRGPRDLRIELLTGPSGDDRWGWARSLPHARPQELTALVAARAVAGDHDDRPDVLVFVDGARLLPDATVLTVGPAVGVYTICVDPEERLLPGECAAVVRATSGGLTVRRNGGPEVTGVRPDEVTPQWCDRVARALAREDHAKAP